MIKKIYVDEETEYPKLLLPSDCKQDVKNFFDTHQHHPPKDAPDALKAAYHELQRIL